MSPDLAKDPSSIIKWKEIKKISKLTLGIHIHTCIHTYMNQQCMPKYMSIYMYRSNKCVTKIWGIFFKNSQGFCDYTCDHATWPTIKIGTQWYFSLIEDNGII